MITLDNLNEVPSKAGVKGYAIDYKCFLTMDEQRKTEFKKCLKLAKARAFDLCNAKPMRTYNGKILTIYSNNIQKKLDNINEFLTILNK